MSEILIVSSVLLCVVLMVGVVWYSIPSENKVTDPCKIVRKCTVCHGMYCVNEAGARSEISVCPSCYR